jgi:aromatic ring-opening dioxygenase catalytic subunit (LigB family)
MSAEKPDILYDYYGFPPESYTIEWPAPGDPALAARMAEMLWGAGFRAVADPDRGFDHGVFIPLKVSWPEADIPTLQVSLKAGLDPAEHLAMGKALAPLRDEGVLLMGSGMSYHNLRAFRDPSTPKNAEVFDAWLQETVTADAATRDQKLLAWEQAPLARHAHPREEHLIPLMVMAGAAGEDRGSIDFSGLFGGARVSGIRFG